MYQKFSYKNSLSCQRDKIKNSMKGNNPEIETLKEYTEECNINDSFNQELQTLNKKKIREFSTANTK